MFQKSLFLVILAFLLFGVVGCIVADNATSNAEINMNYAKETFNVYYSIKGSDLIINKDTQEWGDLKCGECTYYEFDSYSANSTEKNLFHNVMIIRTSDKAISWFLYDDSGFSTYIMKDNLTIDAHAEKHNNPDVSSFESLENASSYQWWNESSTLFTCIDENGSRNLHVFVTYTPNEILLTFSCSGNGYEWSMFTIHHNDAEYCEEYGEKLISYTGYVNDVYKNGIIYASGIEPNDTINVIYNTTTKTITVTSLLELINGETQYPVMCSGTYNAVE